MPVPHPTRPSRRPVNDERLTIVPANQAAWEDLRAVFGRTGDTARCWCQRFRMLPKESWASEGPEELAARLRDQTACGNRNAQATSGLVAYLDGGSVGTLAMFTGAGFTEVSRPGKRRAVMRIDF